MGEDRRNIQLQLDIWEKMARLKLRLKVKNFNEVVRKMLLMIRKLNLYQELENV